MCVNVNYLMHILKCKRYIFHWFWVFEGVGILCVQTLNI